MKLNYFSDKVMGKVSKLFLIVFMLFIISSGAYSSVDKVTKKDITSIRAGFWGATYLSIDQQQYDLITSYSIGINIDRARGNRYYTGLAIDLFRIRTKHTDEEVSMVNIGFAVKRDYPLKKGGLSIRPSVTVGVALKSELTFVEKSGHITLKAGVDILNSSDKPVSFIMEAGFFWAVAGMENKSKIYSSPAPVFRIGLMF